MTTSAPVSPKWGSTSKLVVALTLLAVSAALLVKFSGYIPPLMMSVILVYLLYPAAAFINRRTKLRWGFSVALIYLLLIIVVLGLAALIGVEIFHQLNGFETRIDSVIDTVQGWLGQTQQVPLVIGPLTLGLDTFDTANLGDQLLSAVQGVLGQTGSMLTAIAGGAINTVGWFFIILMISYFILAESGGLRDELLRFDIPGYNEDIKHMSLELGQIWNAFLRGQLIIVGLTMLLYFTFLSGLGMRYAIILALVGGLTKFLPYIGPAILWPVLGLLAYFQDFTLGGLSHLWYAVLVVIVLMSVDQVIDSLIAPRILAQALKVHPAAIIIATLIGASLLGLLGVVIAAPMMATVQLISRYVIRKLFDLDPWEGLDEWPNPPPFSEQLRGWWAELRTRFARRSK